MLYERAQHAHKLIFMVVQKLLMFKAELPILPPPTYSVLTELYM